MDDGRRPKENGDRMRHRSLNLVKEGFYRITRISRVTSEIDMSIRDRRISYRSISSRFKHVRGGDLGLLRLAFGEEALLPSFEAWIPTKPGYCSI